MTKQNKTTSEPCRVRGASLKCDILDPFGTLYVRRRGFYLYGPFPSFSMNCLLTVGWCSSELSELWLSLALKLVALFKNSASKSRRAFGLVDVVVVVVVVRGGGGGGGVSFFVHSVLFCFV